MHLVKLLVWCALAAPLSARVLLISLDGMGQQFLTEDPLSRELTSLHTFAKKGVQASGVRSHFPSTTANALWTGTWGDVNGIGGNSIPKLPRGQHQITDRLIGYRSDGLEAEPIWVTAARHGIRAVGQQVTQAYPFTERSVGSADLKVPPVVINGYQTRLLADHAALRRADMKEEACPASLPPSRRAPRCFTWTAGPIVLHGALLAPDGAYTVFMIRADGGETPVQAALASTESDAPRKRELARYFSRGLFLPAVADAGPAVLYFRLFEAVPDGSDFLLYETPLHELGVYPEALRASLLRDAGGFIGNGPGRLLREGKLGAGAGVGERRYLEAIELLTSLSLSHTRWLLRHQEPELFAGYLPYPDETEHLWKGLSVLNPSYNEYRRWAYIVVNRYVEALLALRRSGDDMIFVSDHGMTPVHRQVHVNGALLQAGLLSLDSNGKIDPLRTQVIATQNCLLVNTMDWKDGSVSPQHVESVKEQAAQALLGIRDPETGKPVITEIYNSAADAQRFGFGGPGGPQLCYDYAPGYAGVDSTAVPLVQNIKIPVGQHGFAPTRPDMQAIFIAGGPRFPHGRRWPEMRLIDIAPLVSKLLGIEAPAQSSEKVLLPDTKR
jgi:predicted AlkP superfamily phosphohydrolase/phosphomutase